jgi:Tfp pilus assembly protein PilN
MAQQQLNLLTARFVPVQPRLAAAHVPLVALGVLALGALAAMGLRLSADAATAQARQMNASLATLQTQTKALGAAAADAPNAEVNQLKALDAGQRRVLAALQAGVAGGRLGHADHLAALARQATGAVWLTRFSISDDGNSIELEGRMADPAALSPYLRRLNDEARFKGRPFAQLSLKAQEATRDQVAYTAFALRSTPVTPGATITAATTP